MDTLIDNLNTSNTESNTDNYPLIPKKNSDSNQKRKFSPFKGLFRFIRKIRILLIAFILIGSIAIIFTFVNSSKPKVVAQTDSRATVAGAKATMEINKDFSYSIKDDKGKEITKFKYTIENVGLHDEIIVKGQRMVAVKGKTFLIISIKLNNIYESAIEINARNYIRLSVNGDEKELLAADIHNDPVLVQAISTKSTRLGFPVNDSDKNMVLIVGEIKGDKQKIPIVF
jgi:hypothetical protein